ncbi:hypothetical protein ABK040_011708 [Willaertia magna]
MATSASNYNKKLDAINNALYCNNCQTGDYITEDHKEGTMVCTGCGVVVMNSLIDLDREWREFENDSGTKDKSRVAGPVNELLDGGGLSTSIERVKGGTGGLTKTHMKIQQSDNEKHLREAFRKIEDFAEKLGVEHKHFSRVQQIYKELDKKKNFKGRYMDQVVAACLYTGLKAEAVSRTIKEIIVLTNTKKKEVNKYIQLINSDENLKKLLKSTSYNSPKDYVEKYTAELELPVYLQTATQEVAENVMKYGVGYGKSPVTLAAASIVLLCQSQPDEQFKRTAKDVEGVMGISETTIKKALKELEKEKEKLLPAKYSVKQQ